MQHKGTQYSVVNLLIRAVVPFVSEVFSSNFAPGYRPITNHVAPLFFNRGLKRGLCK